MKYLSKLVTLWLVGAGLAFAGPQDNTLVVGASQEPTVLGGDFLGIISNQSIKAEVENYLLVPMIGIDADSKNFPIMVTELPTLANRRLRSVDIGGGKRRLEMDLTLRSDLKWSDGTPITTDDIAFFNEVGNAKGMPVLDPDVWERRKLIVKDKLNFTVTFEPAFYTDTIGAPIGYAPAHVMRPEWQKVLAQTQNLDAKRDAARLSEIYRNFFQTFGSNRAINQGKMVWSGPFQVSRWAAGSTIELTRNPNFWITPPGGTDKYVQKVTYRIIQNTNSLLVAILGGGVDVTSRVSITLDQARSPQLTSRAPGRYDIWSVPGAVWEHIDINKFTNVERVKELGLDDKRTRQALLYALDRDSWVKAFFGGLEPVSHAWIAPVNPLFNDKVRRYEYNPDKAKALLAEMGWRPGPDGILQRTVGGKTVRFEIEFVTTSGNAIRERTQQLFAEQWKRIGVAVKINNAPSSVVFDSKYINRAVEGTWTGMFMFAWVASLAELGNLFKYKDLNTGAIYVPTAENNFTGQNIGGWRNDEFDRLAAQAVVEFDPEKRAELFARMQAIWAEELPALPLRFRADPLITKKGLVNYLGATYSGGTNYPNWLPWAIGWTARGAQKLFDQAKYATPISTK